MDHLLLDISSYCCNLRPLSLENLAPEGAHISPQSLVGLAQKLNRLEEHAFPTKTRKSKNSLRLSFKCHLTEAALVEAAKSYKTLTGLEIWGSYNLQNLGKTEVSFSKLKTLELGHLVPPSVLTDTMAMEAADAAGLLKRVAPSLEEFDVMFPNTFSKMVSREVDNINLSKKTDEGLPVT
ncbi:hypothetical protein M434DRAFT_108745 [Hypoxylon sp. CO27-5]|nr:hypothetical protein M434DRAFT_108745 [Hypoxylon sp. CO27-5]